MKNLSRFLARVLRHAPESVGLALDRQGWADVEDLILKCARVEKTFDRATLLTIVENDAKGRFTLSPDGRRIRAAQGHSVAVELGLPHAEPPEILYHGTAEARLVSIFAEGLKPGRRLQVHLSLDVATAVAVGRRHGRPVVLRVSAGLMHAEGFLFQRADNGVWLTDIVPARFLENV